MVHLWGLTSSIICNKKQKFGLGPWLEPMLDPEFHAMCWLCLVVSPIHTVSVFNALGQNNRPLTCSQTLSSFCTFNYLIIGFKIWRITSELSKQDHISWWEGHPGAAAVQLYINTKGQTVFFVIKFQHLSVRSFRSWKNTTWTCQQVKKLQFFMTTKLHLLSTTPRTLLFHTC